MSQDSEYSTASASSEVNTKVVPDFFSFYTSEVLELLSGDDLVPFSRLVGNQHEVGKEKGKTKNSETKENNINGSSFSNGIGARLSELKKERLKSLLRQSVSTLTKEVDEIIDPVLSVCQIRSCLKCKESLLSLDASTCKVDQPQPPHKRFKRDCSLENGAIMDSKSNTEGGKECPEVDEDLRFLLESDTTKVEELVNKQSDEFCATLDHMEQKLEELMNILMTTCRPMTLAEKQHIRKSIQKLPPKNLDRVVEIIGSNNSQSEKYSFDEVHVDLDGMENATLWRLYFYVRTVEASTT